jgi:hypothetical protein
MNRARGRLQVSQLHGASSESNLELNKGSRLLAYSYL